MDRVILERMKAPLRRFAPYRALRFIWHFATDAVFRRDYIRRVRRPAGQFQYRSLTMPARYPRVFAFVQAQLAAVREPRLLSFGCATGEEVFSLRGRFPEAFIKGIDIDPGNVTHGERERARRRDTRIEFACAASADNEAPASYDAIFCLAVFQHSALKNPALRTCEKYIRFADFEAVLGGIARTLKPGGLLAIRHADFRFADTVCSGGFRPVLRLPPRGAPHPRFDRENRRLPDEYDGDVVWQKIADT